MQCWSCSCPRADGLRQRHAANLDGWEPSVLRERASRQRVVQAQDGKKRKSRPSNLRRNLWVRPGRAPAWPCPRQAASQECCGKLGYYSHACTRGMMFGRHCRGRPAAIVGPGDSSMPVRKQRRAAPETPLGCRDTCYSPTPFSSISEMKICPMILSRGNRQSSASRSSSSGAELLSAADRGAARRRRSRANVDKSAARPSIGLRTSRTITATIPRAGGV